MGDRLRGTQKNWPLLLRCLCEGEPSRLADCPFLLHGSALHIISSVTAVPGPDSRGAVSQGQGLGLQQFTVEKPRLSTTLPSATVSCSLAHPACPKAPSCVSSSLLLSLPPILFGWWEPLCQRAISGPGRLLNCDYHSICVRACLLLRSLTIGTKCSSCWAGGRGSPLVPFSTFALGLGLTGCLNKVVIAAPAPARLGLEDSPPPPPHAASSSFFGSCHTSAW